ncbi:hypothetical protein R6Q59_003961 [Mikania micrantha]
MEGGDAATPPATPGTPGGPLFTSLRVESLSHDPKSMPRRKCLPLDAPLPHTCFTDFPTPDISLTRKLGAEFVGTFILIFAATAGPILNEKYSNSETLIGNAACAGLAVMIIILSTGHISGAHLNPSLTIAFAALRHFPWAQVPAYIVAQVSASICASFALKGWRIGRYCSWSYSYAQHSCCRKIKWWFNEPGAYTRSSHCRGELQGDMGLPVGSHTWGPSWSRYLHIGQTSNE